MFTGPKAKACNISLLCVGKQQVQGFIVACIAVNILVDMVKVPRDNNEGVQMCHLQLREGGVNVLTGCCSIGRGRDVNSEHDDMWKLPGQVV